MDILCSYFAQYQNCIYYFSKLVDRTIQLELYVLPVPHSKTRLKIRLYSNIQRGIAEDQ